MPLIMDESLPDVASMQVTSSASMPRSLCIKNRRKRYLESHPGYFDSSLELADPLLYDRLIRRFQTPAECELERRQKGYAGTLEADLFRSEARLDEARGGSSAAELGPDGRETSGQQSSDTSTRNEDLTREEASEQWHETMMARFLAGEDPDFEYRTVDDNEDYDDRRMEERDQEDEYFDEEVPRVAGMDEREEKTELQGETGIQDF